MKTVPRESSFSETGWIATLIGTAIGAGILYLPLQVGISTIWALAFLSVLVFPLIYHAHKSIITLLFLGKTGLDYSGVVASHLGRGFGSLTTLLYFVTFVAALLSYSTGMNDNLGEYLFKTGVTGANWAKGPYLSLLILSSFAALSLIGERTIIRVMMALTLFLILALFGISIYLIPLWDLSTIRQELTFAAFVNDVLLILPILTLSFVFFPPISSMVAAYEKSELSSRGVAERELNRIILRTSLILLIFVLLFVYSCVFALTPAEFEHAVKENLNCLTVLSYKKEISPALANLGVFVGIAALYTSFVGVFFAVRDSAHELISNISRYELFNNIRILKNRKIMNYSVLIIINVSIWIMTAADLSIINIIGLIISPLVALFVFILPVVIIAKADYKRMLKEPSHIFVLLTGILILFSYELGTLLKEYLSR